MRTVLQTLLLCRMAHFCCKTRVLYWNPRRKVNIWNKAEQEFSCYGKDSHLSAFGKHAFLKSGLPQRWTGTPAVGFNCCSLNPFYLMRRLPAVLNLQHGWLLEALFICQKKILGKQTKVPSLRNTKICNWRRFLRRRTELTNSLWKPFGGGGVFLLVVQSLPCLFVSPELVCAILCPNWPLRGDMEMCGAGGWAPDSEPNWWPIPSGAPHSLILDTTLFSHIILVNVTECTFSMFS